MDAAEVPVAVAVPEARQADDRQHSLAASVPAEPAVQTCRQHQSRRLGQAEERQHAMDLPELPVAAAEAVALEADKRQHCLAVVVPAKPAVHGCRQQKSPRVRQAEEHQRALDEPEEPVAVAAAEARAADEGKH